MTPRRPAAGLPAPGAGEKDGRGRGEGKCVLAVGRGHAVEMYLAENGISEERLLYVGYGEYKPKVVDSLTALKYDFMAMGVTLNEPFIVALETEEQREIAHQLNRRTEFKILTVDFKPGMDLKKLKGVKPEEEEQEKKKKEK